jgi:pimeloyl-ACP methyl ester carboxylesterase
VATLLVDAADDHLVPYDHVPSAAAGIPGAQLVTIEGGGHLFLQRAEKVRAATTTFITATVSPDLFPREPRRPVMSSWA